MNFFKGIPTYYYYLGQSEPFHTSNKIVRILLLIIKNNAFPPLFAGAAREERKSTYDES
jgi:hypothetical protein